MESGIYTITNLIGGKIYLGYSKNMWTRKNGHFSDLRRNRHRNIHLQRAFNKHGEENFLFEVLVECEEEFLPSEEHYWATLLNVHNREFGYNIEPTHPYGEMKRRAKETARIIADYNRIRNVKDIPRKKKGKYTEEQKLRLRETRRKNGTERLSEEAIQARMDKMRSQMTPEQRERCIKQYNLSKQGKTRADYIRGVLVYDRDWNYIGEFDSGRKATLSLFGSYKGLNMNEKKLQNGYYYRWKDEVEDRYNPNKDDAPLPGWTSLSSSKLRESNKEQYDSLKKSIYIYDLEWNFIEEAESVKYIIETRGFTNTIYSKIRQGKSYKSLNFKPKCDVKDKFNPWGITNPFSI